MKVYFRADGNSHIGLGHIVRCGALAQMIKDEFTCILFTRCTDNSIINKLKDIYIEIIIIPSDINYINEPKFILDLIKSEKSIIVLDGYDFKTEYQEFFTGGKLKLVSIDDLHNCHFLSDAIINHSISASKSEYSAEPYTEFYLGLDYALLRPAFQENACNRKGKSFKRNSNVFISLGGADPNNELFSLLDFLKNIAIGKTIKYKVVVGSSYKYYDELMNSGFLKFLDIEVYKDLSEEKMFSLMSSCSTAICSPSSVAIEYMAVGGGLYLKCIAENQVEFYNKLLKLNLAFRFNIFGCRNADADNEVMYKRHCSLIDGKQKDRFIKIFKKLSD